MNSATCFCCALGVRPTHAAYVLAWPPRNERLLHIFVTRQVSWAFARASHLKCAHLSKG